jgi:hypothetical protein
MLRGYICRLYVHIYTVKIAQQFRQFGVPRVVTLTRAARESTDNKQCGPLSRKLGHPDLNHELQLMVYYCPWIIVSLLNQLNAHNYSHINITYIAATCFGVHNTIFREHVMPSLKPFISKQAYRMWNHKNKWLVYWQLVLNLASRAPWRWCVVRRNMSQRYM